MASINEELATECKRQSENCLYTSTALFIWLKFLRGLRIFFAVVPLILGSLASWKLLTSLDLTNVKIFIAVISFIAGIMPTIYAVLKVDEYLGKAANIAGDFKNLQDRFRQAALVSSKKPFNEFEKDFNKIVESLERARSNSITPPEWCFKRAQAKIKSGDYDFDVDIIRAKEKEN
ncbi:MAG: hypothetical protein ACE5KZ_05835 [Candidatus Scalinduaceae bacterium]